MQLSSKSNSHPANFQIPSVNFRIPFYPQVKLHDDDDHSDAGHLRIISNSGEILYRRGEPIIQKRRHLLALGGTLVEWDIVRTAKVEA